MKKYFHLLLSVMLVFSIFGSSVYATTTDTIEENTDTEGAEATTATEAAFDIQLQEPKFEEGKVKLKWRIVSDTELTLPEEGQAFTIKKNEELVLVTLKPLATEKNPDQTKVYTVYEYTDEKVIENDEYTYSITQEKTSSNQMTVSTKDETQSEESEPAQPDETEAPATEEETATAPEENPAKEEEKTEETEEQPVHEFGAVAHRVTDTSAQISWNPNDEDNFEVYVNDELKATLPGYQSYYHIEGLEADKTYKIRIDGLKDGKVAVSSELEIKTSPAPQGKPVEFKDEALYLAVQEELGLKREIYQTDIEKLKSLSISWLFVESLEGLQHAVNLEQLFIGYNSITDLSPIKNLNKLNTLDVSGLTIKDTSVITGLTNIKELYVSHTNLPNLDFLKSMPNLQIVYLYGELWIAESPAAQKVISELEAKGITVYSDYESDLNLYVEKGFVNESKIQVVWDYWPEANFDSYPDSFIVSIDGKEEKLSGDTWDKTFTNLKANTEYEIVIKAYESKRLIGKSTMKIKTAEEPTGEAVKIKDKNLASAIKRTLGLDRDIRESDMERLTQLMVDGENIKNLSGLEKAVNLETLSLWGTKVVDLTPIQGLTKLAYLDLDETGVINLHPIKSLTNLSSLYVSYLGVKDFSPILGLKNLNALGLAGNDLKKLPNLSSLNNLVELDLTGNELASLKGLEGANRLQYLTVDFNPLSDYSALSNLPILGLSAAYTAMSSLDWAATDMLSRMEILILTGNPVTDLSPLKGMRHLQMLVADETELTNIKTLLDLPYLFYVSLVNIQTLDISEGSDAMKVIEELIARGVMVDYGEATEEVFFYISDWESSYDSVNVTWAYEGEEKIESYNLYLDGEKVDNVPASANSYLYTGLAPNSSYEVEIEAVNADGEEVAWAYELVHTLSEDLYFTDIQTTTDTINAAWVYEGEEEVYEYDLILDGEIYDSVEPDTLEYVFEELESDTLYKVELYAWSEEDELLGYTFSKATTDSEDGNPGDGDGQTPPPGKTPGGSKKPSDIIDDKKQNFGSKPNKQGDDKKKQTGKKLPNTSTNMYNYIAMGVTILLAGMILLLVSRKRKVQG